MERDRGGRREYRGYDERGELQHGNHEVPPDLRIPEIARSWPMSKY
jgi:hypothetical protein